MNLACTSYNNFDATIACLPFVENDTVCCGPDEVDAMEANLVMAEGIFGRCPACFYNMVRSICAFACAQDQSRFLTPTLATVEVDDDEGIRNVTYVASVRYNINERYVNGTYDSCKAVSMPATSGVAMDLACGSFNSKTCNPIRWYQYMGDADNNMFVPFPINYEFTNHSDAFDYDTRHCGSSNSVRFT